MCHLDQIREKLLSGRVCSARDFHEHGLRKFQVFQFAL
ncbi:hypothetical protein MPLA_1800178 [Mesorhizobium sp. ORS 3359]|nr:hypothetical protein MPLA_1800178 [Mesorhizobium sp. ORS 3359]